MKIVVPTGAEAAAVRRVVPSAIAVKPGAASGGGLPEVAPGETVVVLGLCGALARLRAGDVAIYANVRDDRCAFALDAELVDALAHALPRAAVVDAYTAERVVTTGAARAAIARRSGADVVDMEGTHLAAALARRGARVAMVRVVSDDAVHDLPPIEDAIGPDGRIRPLVLAGAFARAPRAAFTFVTNVRAALRALTTTAAALATAELV